MNERDLYNLVNERTVNSREWEQGLAFPALMRKVYVWMAMALAITGVTAFGVASSPALIQTIYSSQMAFWILALAELGIVFYTTARLDKLSLTTATMLFIIFSVLNGVTMSYIFLVYTLSSIATTFFITAGTFAAMALVGYTTKRDLTKMGGILFMALIGLIIAGIVNIFLKNSMFDMVISGVGVLVFVGLTAWDSQKIKQMLLMAPDSSEASQKVALMGSLALYLDFINMFIYLLRFFGRRD